MVVNVVEVGCVVLLSSRRRNTRGALVTEVQTCALPIYSFVAGALAPHGISTIVINYDLCPEVQGSDIVEQVKRAFSWIRDNAGAYGCQAINMTASGHSAGAHLDRKSVV